MLTHSIWWPDGKWIIYDHIWFIYDHVWTMYGHIWFHIWSYMILYKHLITLWGLTHSATGKACGWQWTTCASFVHQLEHGVVASLSVGSTRPQSVPFGSARPAPTQGRLDVDRAVKVDSMIDEAINVVSMYKSNVSTSILFVLSWWGMIIYGHIWPSVDKTHLWTYMNVLEVWSYIIIYDNIYSVFHRGTVLKIFFFMEWHWNLSNC